MQGGHPLAFQCASEPVSVVTANFEHPFGSRKDAQQGGGSGVVADLPCNDEELLRPSLGVCYGMQLRV